MNMASQFSISDLAKEFDLTTRAIRFYEDMGLLEPERSGPGGRNRVYSSRDRTRLKLTLRAKRLGLSLVVRFPHKIKKRGCITGGVGLRCARPQGRHHARLAQW